MAVIPQRVVDETDSLKIRVDTQAVLLSYV
jgi:hypothetical protein